MDGDGVPGRLVEPSRVLFDGKRGCLREGGWESSYSMSKGGWVAFQQLGYVVKPTKVLSDGKRKGE